MSGTPEQNLPPCERDYMREQVTGQPHTPTPAEEQATIALRDELLKHGGQQLLNDVVADPQKHSSLFTTPEQGALLRELVHAADARKDHNRALLQKYRDEGRDVAIKTVLEGGNDTIDRLAILRDSYDGGLRSTLSSDYVPPHVKIPRKPIIVQHRPVTPPFQVSVDGRYLLVAGGPFGTGLVYKIEVDSAEQLRRELAAHITAARDMSSRDEFLKEHTGTWPAVYRPPTDTVVDCRGGRIAYGLQHIILGLDKNPYEAMGIPKEVLEAGGRDSAPMPLTQALIQQAMGLTDMSQDNQIAEALEQEAAQDKAASEYLYMYDDNIEEGCAPDADTEAIMDAEDKAEAEQEFAIEDELVHNEIMAEVDIALPPCLPSGDTAAISQAIGDDNSPSDLDYDPHADPNYTRRYASELPSQPDANGMRTYTCECGCQQFDSTSIPISCKGCGKLHYFSEYTPVMSKGSIYVAEGPNVDDD